MEKHQKFSIWYVLLGVWIVLILQNYITSMFAVKTIPYSEFLKLLKEKKVIEVAISANQIQGKVKDDAAAKKKQAGMAEFEEAVERVIAGLEKKNRLINPKEREIVAYHEMGHAIVALSLPGADPVQKISIIPRGIAALGYTMQTPTEDRFLMTKTELLNKIATLLGGRAAEEIVFEDISTGAHSDLARATDIARSMVKEYGMSAKVGQVYFAREKRNQFLNIPMEGAAEYSEATAELIDDAVREIINDQYAKTRQILKERRDILDKGAQLLLEKEKIEGTELTNLMGEI